MRKRSWTDQELKKAVVASRSLRSVIKSLGLVPAGRNYSVITLKIKEQGLDISHFTGKRWNKGVKGGYNPRRSLKTLLNNGVPFQSFKLKKRLFHEGLKKTKCELCGWCQESKDGRIPLELDHVNGDRNDNRLLNLRILCPNCHSLQPTHRGRNIGSHKK